MSEHSDNHAELLQAIHGLELKMLQRLNDQASEFRTRIEDIERRHQLDLKEFQIKVWERFDRINNDLYRKTDGQRAHDYKGYMMLAATTGISILFAVFSFMARRT